jgi:phosphate/phosphite/phosphonate ABC transporter binding protein
VLADVTDEPIKKTERFQPLADYLADRLHDFGIGVGVVKIAPDTSTMAAMMQNAQVDIYFDSPFPAMIVSDQSGAQPILRRWKDGVGEYYSLFFAQAHLGIDKVSDLDGRLVAFEDANSTSGFMLPLAHLVQNGLTPVETVPGAMPAADEVGYVFAGDDENIVHWVLDGRVAAGVVDEETFREIPDETRATLGIFSITETVPRQVVLVRPGLDPDLQRAITAILEQMHTTEEGRAVLEIFRSNRFDAFPGGTDSAFGRLREMYAATR